MELYATTPTMANYQSFSLPTTPIHSTTSIPSMSLSVPSTPTGSVCSEFRGDIHSGSLVRGLWSAEEHEQFLQGMKMYPKGPWRAIAAFIGTRSIKQVQTHAQKYQQKINRRQRGLRKQKKKFVRPEHRVDAHASGCIIRTKNACDSPRSPAGLVRKLSHKSYAHMLAEPTTRDSIDEYSDDDIDFAALIDGLEPFPFTTVPCEELFALDDRYSQDLQESIDLLLQ